MEIIAACIIAAFIVAAKLALWADLNKRDIHEEVREETDKIARMM